jgi:hypothetical protein
MKKLGFLLLLLVAAVMLGGTALAQGDNTVYFTTYFSNANTANARKQPSVRSTMATQKITCTPPSTCSTTARN